MSAVRADVPLRTEEIARILGWKTRDTAKWLDGLARQDPSIVVRVNGRRMATLASLRKVVPDIGRRFASDRDLEEVREEQDQQRKDIELIAEDVREFRRKSNEWFRSLSQRMNAVEKSLRLASEKRRSTT